jgi:hypothetical protein
MDTDSWPEDDGAAISVATVPPIAEPAWGFPADAFQAGGKRAYVDATSVPPGLLEYLAFHEKQAIASEKRASKLKSCATLTVAASSQEGSE